MKTFNIAKKFFAVTALGIFTVSIVNAQTSSQINNAIPPPPPPINGAPIPPPGIGKPMQQQLQELSSVTGSFIKMVFNDDYVYDGFYLLSNGDSLLVKFPPHIGKQIMDVVKSGTTITVNGSIATNPMNVREIRMYSLKAGNTSVSDTINAIPPTQAVESYTSGNGKITQIQTNREGVINGLIVDGKTILRIPPHIANQLSSIAQANTSVAFTGMKKNINAGEVSPGDYAVIHCQTLTLNGKQYLIQ